MMGGDRSPPDLFIISLDRHHLPVNEARPSVLEQRLRLGNAKGARTLAGGL